MKKYIAAIAIATALSSAQAGIIMYAGGAYAGGQFNVTDDKMSCPDGQFAMTASDNTGKNEFVACYLPVNGGILVKGPKGDVMLPDSQFTITDYGYRVRRYKQEAEIKKKYKN